MAGFGTKAEELLQRLESETFENEADAVASLVEVTIALNVDISDEIRGSGDSLVAMGGISDKLKEIIKRLVALLKKIASEYGAFSYSIGVSLTGVELSVEWAGPKRDRLSS
jgi:hypothetical protein